ncbi:MAG: hypothetical protein M1832_004250 [Thelocarpon impressellum]|nr:MAG: hypothetical protein M1832_004250 [Thelocarpon impressellum]
MGDPTGAGGVFQISVKDFGKRNAAKYPNPALSRRMVRQTFDLGTTQKRNSDFVRGLRKDGLRKGLADPEVGTGILWDTYKKKAATLKAVPSSELFEEALLEDGLGLRIPDTVRTMLQWHRENAVPQNCDKAILSWELRDSLSELDNMGPTIFFNIDTPTAPTISSVHSSFATFEQGPLVESYSSRTHLDTQITMLPSEQLSPEEEAMLEELYGLETIESAGSCGAGHRRRSCVGGRKAATSVATVVEEDGLKTIRLFKQATLHAVGAIGIGVGAAFVISDFVNDRPVEGAIALASLVTGVLGTLLGETPIGWALFATSIALSTRPGEFQGKRFPKKDLTEIVRYKMFGDPDHTGNEKCREDRDGVKANPKCQVVYAAGHIMKAFGWDAYTAIAFAQVAGGRPMSIPTMVSHLALIDDNASPDASDKVATVKCGFRALENYDYYSPQEETCQHAEITLNKAKLILPGINQTAADVEKRLVTEKGGDCVLVASSVHIYHAVYDMNLMGAPAAIACNVTEAINVNGTARRLVNGQMQTLNGTEAKDAAPPFSPANASTDGKIHYVAPDAPSRFAELNASVAACLGDADGKQLCLPNGTYVPPTGELGFGKAQITSLAMPPDARLMTMASQGTIGIIYRMTWTLWRRYFQGNVTGDQLRDLDRAMKGADTVRATATFDVLLRTPDPPAACIFTKPNYEGDVICLGPGGGNLTAPLVDRARSIALHAGAQMMIYAQHYADAGGQAIKHSVDDLSRVRYGKDGNFDGKIKALYIVAGNLPVA